MNKFLLLLLVQNRAQPHWRELAEYLVILPGQVLYKQRV